MAGVHQFTSFGRDFLAFTDLEAALSGYKGSLNCLIIGPGLNKNSKGIRTFQPFELINVLYNLDITDFKIDVLERDYEIIRAFDQRLLELNVPDEQTFGYPEQYPQFLHYYNHFSENIPGYQKFLSGEGKIQILFPDAVFAHLNIINFDLMKEEIPQKRYDIAICTRVIGYLPEQMRQQARRQICDRIPSEGYLISNFNPLPAKDWKKIPQSFDEGFLYKRK